MAYRTWATGETITSTLLNAQSPTLCTSTTRPLGTNLYEGVIITETDTDRVMYYDSVGWVILGEPTQTYTPTATNLNVGTGGTLTGTFHRSDGWMDLQIYAVMGTSGFSVTGNPIFSLPTGSPAIQPVTTLELMKGQSILNDATGSRWYGQAYHDSFNGIGVTYGGAATTPSGNTAITAGGITATVPFTWATNDHIHVWVRFQMSNRHSFV